jgi:hypothetical protein
MIRVMGRVCATVCLKAEGPGTARVIATSWASDRAFPRTAGVAVAFEVEASDGEVTRVEPFEAFVTLPVRGRDARDGVRHEAAWLAAGDEVTVEGELEPGGHVLRAARITAGGGTSLHRLPPRALQRGASEPIVSRPAAVAAPVPPSPSAESVPESEAALAPRRPKKKRPDSSGTPTPDQ